MNFPFDDWRSRLEGLIVQALMDFRSRVPEKMTMFSVDCHPWHGRIGLAFLTEKAASKEPFLKDPDELAGWDYFNFADKPFFYEEVGKEMDAAYHQTAKGNKETTDRFFRQVALAVSGKEVQEALQAFNLTEDFKITITHPDSGKEFYRS